MTDGIIQKVINKYKKDNLLSSLDIYANYDNILNQINREILLELRKLNKHRTRHNGQQFIAVSLRALIGDNEN